jgi:hypothetical protein
LSSTTRRTVPRSAQRGQAIVLFAGALVTLLLVAALAFDVGMMLVERRDQQNAADAAALAGARFALTSDSDARDAARRIALMNGFDDADANEVVNVYIPPIHGPAVYRQPGFVEVQIEATRPSIFGGIIGEALWPVGAFAIATNRQDLIFTFSMLALDPAECKAIQVSGTGAVVSAGSIQSNSSGAGCTTGAPISFSRTGGSTITVGADVYCRAVGQIQDQGAGSFGSCVKTPDSFALPDPLRNLPAPIKPPLAAPMVSADTPGQTIPKHCPGSTAKPPDEAQPVTCKLAVTGGYSGTEWILYPGLYPGGLEITSDTTAYLMPGIYWIGGGGLRVATGGSIYSIGSEADAASLQAGAAWDTLPGGVMIFNSKLPTADAGPIVFDGSSATMKLKPLSATSPDPNAIYNDIVIFQDRTLDVAGDDVTLNGAASVATVEGMVYVPRGKVTLNGNGGTLTVGQVIANTFNIMGNGGTINVVEDDLYPSIIVAAGLVY